MSRQRRIRDETGGSVYYDIDESDVVQSTWSGAGLAFDTIKNVAANVASKLTGKAPKKIATKAAEKLVEKGAEKVGEKTGQLIGEKIYDRFSQGAKKNRGDLIIKELQKNKKPPGDRESQDKVMEDKVISQQFEDLLNLF